jgi:peptide/nickel transport system ATP-binding protein
LRVWCQPKCLDPVEVLSDDTATLFANAAEANAMVTSEGEKTADTNSASPTPLLQVDSLTLDYASVDGRVRVLNDVSMNVRKGEIVGIVGESGSGKSTLGLSVIGLLDIPPAEIIRGSIVFEGTDLIGTGAGKLLELRGRGIGMIFQESLTSLNPVYKTEAQLGESLRIMRKVENLGRSKEADRELMLKVLSDLHIDRPESVLMKYPHQLSGGMRQRVSIAMSIVEKPKLLILDEVTTGLDVYVQNRLLQLLKELNASKGVSMLLVTHDLTVASQICDRLYVMYAGRLVEEGMTEDVLGDPLHPYTQGLLSSIPQGYSDSPQLPGPRGDPPDLRHLPPGCKFNPRCPYVFDRCLKEEPPLVEVRPGRLAACWKVTD